MPAHRYRYTNGNGMVRGPVTMHTRNVSTIMAATVMTSRVAMLFLEARPRAPRVVSMVFSVLMLLSFRVGPSGRAGGNRAHEGRPVVRGCSSGLLLLV